MHKLVPLVLVPLVLVFLGGCATQPASVPEQASTQPKAVCSQAAASELVRLRPAPGALYRDPDDAAQIRVKIESDSQLNAVSTSMDKLNLNVSAKILATNYSALAYTYALRGDCRSAQDYNQRALATNGDPMHVAWSYGWSKIALADYVGAVNVWTKSVPQPGGKPFWLAYSLAVAFEGAGEHELAQAWWRAAVASNPELATKAGALKFFDHWRANEKALLLQLLEQV